MSDKTIPTSAVLYVKNNGNNIRTFEWDRTTWTIAPGQEVVAPYFAVCYWFGDPRSVDIGDRDAHQETQYRTNDVRRLGVLYGTYDHPWSRPEPFIARDATDDRPETDREYELRADGHYYHPNLPNVTVRDQDGADVPVVLNDPYGTKNKPDATTLAQTSTLETSVADLQRQLAQMQTQLAVQQQQLTANPDFEDGIAAKVDLPATMPEAAASDDQGELASLPPTRPSVDRPQRGRPRKAN